MEKSSCIRAAKRNPTIFRSHFLGIHIKHHHLDRAQGFFSTLTKHAFFSKDTMGTHVCQFHTPSFGENVDSAGHSSSHVDVTQQQDFRSKRQAEKDCSEGLNRSHSPPIYLTTRRLSQPKKVKWSLPPGDRWASLLHETCSDSNKQARASRISSNACLPRRR